MTEIEHRYLKDNNDNIFYPLTHIDAVQGLDADAFSQSDEIDDKIKQKTDEINDKIDKANKTIEEANKTISKQQSAIDNNKKTIDEISKTLGNVAGDTGWIDYQVHPDNDKNYLSSAPPCSIREVRIGNSSTGKQFILRSIRVNIGKIYHSQTIAQLPQGFTNETVSFVLRSTGGKAPVELSIEKDNSVKAFLNSGDSNVWATGEFTWLV